MQYNGLVKHGWYEVVLPSIVCRFYHSTAVWIWESHLNVSVQGSPCIKLANSMDLQNHCKNEVLVKVPSSEEALLPTQLNVYTPWYRMLSFAFAHSENLTLFQRMYF